MVKWNIKVLWWFANICVINCVETQCASGSKYCVPEFESGLDEFADREYSYLDEVKDRLTLTAVYFTQPGLVLVVAIVCAVCVYIQWQKNADLQSLQQESEKRALETNVIGYSTEMNKKFGQLKREKHDLHQQKEHEREELVELHNIELSKIRSEHEQELQSVVENMECELKKAKDNQIKALQKCEQLKREKLDFERDYADREKNSMQGNERKLNFEKAKYEQLEVRYTAMYNEFTDIEKELYDIKEKLRKEQTKNDVLQAENDSLKKEIETQSSPPGTGVVRNVLKFVGFGPGKSHGHPRPEAKINTDSEQASNEPATSDFAPVQSNV